MTNKRTTIRSQSDIEAFEAERPLLDRIPPSILELFEASAARFGPSTALSMVETGADDEEPRLISYAQLLKDIRQTANLFAAVVNPGSGVAYLLPTLLETQVSLWAAETAGYAVPLNPLLQVEQLIDLIQASGAKALVTCGPAITPAIWEKSLAVQASLPDLKLICITPPTSGTAGSNVIDFHAARAQHARDRLTFELEEHPGRIVAYFHTGGTTGVPKLVAHTHLNQLAAALGAATLLDVMPDDVVTNGMPLFHVGGAIVSSLAFFSKGATVLSLSAQGLRNPVMVRNFWQIVERHGVTIVGAVPTAFIAILEGPVDANLHKVRFGITGSAPTPRSLVDKFSAATGRHLYEILGMTESGGATAVDPTGIPATTGSVGLRLPYTKLRILKRLDSGQLGGECTTGGTGVLVVTGPTVSPGYKDSAQNKGVFEGGILNTGDLARMDEDGKVFICGRAKDLIIRGGHNIDPAMIEAAFAAHPDVLMAAAVGQPDAYAGELPICYVTLSQDAKVDPEGLMSFARDRIAERPAWPKNLQIMSSLPLTAVGKVFKPALRADAAVRAVQPLLVEAVGAGLIEIGTVDNAERGISVEVRVHDDDGKHAAELVLSKFTFPYRIVLPGDHAK